jgi:glycosyltransferase involved in cell wall biosynthesis
MAQPHVCMIAYTTYLMDARVAREAETLAARGFQVLCLTTRNGAGRHTFRRGGVEVRELGVPKYRGKSTLAYVLSYARFLLSSSAACAWLLVKRRVDVVHVHNLPDFLVFAGLLPRLFGKKVVLDIHDSVPETFAAKFQRGTLVQRVLRLEERLSVSLAHRVICVNHPQREVLVGRGIPDVKTFVSMNVPDPRVFAPVRRGPHGADPAVFNLVYHGTMAERQGIDLLIRAVARLSGRIPGVRLHLWGQGDDLARFMELTQELNVAQHVLFEPDGIPVHDLARHLSSMDVGVIGSRQSAAGDLMLPAKLLEYVALRIPAVVPRLRTIRHYFSDDMVTYFTPGDDASLAEGVYRLFLEPERRRAQAERAAQFLVEYGWERQGEDFVGLYQGLVRELRAS